MKAADLLRAARAAVAAFRGALRPRLDPKDFAPRKPAEPAAAAPTRAKPARTLSPRVLELLREIDLDPADFHARGGRPPSPRVVCAAAARQVVVQKLRSEGLTLRQIALACAINPTTVVACLKGKPRTKRAMPAPAAAPGCPDPTCLDPDEPEPY